jgi:hypothetical protein
MKYNNDEGIAYVWFMLVVLLVVGSITWMVMATGFNQFTSIFNTQIASGTVSEQTRAAVNFNMLAMASVPIIFLIGTFVYAIMASVEKGRT